jgi:hypothetical protein
MEIKWMFDLEFPEVASPVIRDDSKWLHNKLVEVTRLTFVDGRLDLVTCTAKETPSSLSYEVYRVDEVLEHRQTMIPDRSELDTILPQVEARAKVEVLIRSAKLCGVQDAIKAVRGMLKCQEEFIKGVDDLYIALDALEAKQA